MTDENVLVVIEGDIAAGKTTFGKSLEEKGFYFIQESYSECKWLNLFYAEKNIGRASSYLFQFQTWLIEDNETRMMKILDLLKSGTRKIVMDRCILGCKSFLCVYRDRGFMSVEKCAALGALVDVIFSEFHERIMKCFDRTMLINLWVSSDIGYDRYIMRQGSAPTKIDFDSYKWLGKSTMFNVYRWYFTDSEKINTDEFPFTCRLIQ